MRTGRFSRTSASVVAAIVESVSSATLRLTFDDGPAEDTDQLLGVLARYAVKATFFLVGAQIAGRERTVELLAQAGHTVGNHSWDHPDLRALSLHEVRSQLTATSDAIEAVTGARPTLFRPPYGYTSTPIDALARGLGMRTIMWDLDTRDWDLPGAPAIAESILTAPPGAVILLHDGPKARRETVAAVEIALAAKGCSQSIA